MAGRFTFAVPRRTENHVHIPRGINNSSVSITVGFTPGGGRVVIARGREGKSATMAFVSSRGAK